MMHGNDTHAVQRILGDSIHVTVHEFDQIQRTMQDVESSLPLSFAEDMQRCTQVCSILGLQLFELQGRQWRVVVTDADIMRDNTLNRRSTERTEP